MIPDMDPQSVKDSSSFGLRAAGVLKYHRESEDKINLTAIPAVSQPLISYPLECEYCGKNAKPSLDLRLAQGPEMAQSFCCKDRLHLWESLERLRCLAEGRCHLGISGASVKDERSAEWDELLLKDGEMEDYDQFAMDVGSRQLSEARIEDYKIYQAEAKPIPSSAGVLRYQYSLDSEKGYRTVPPGTLTERFVDVEKEDEQVLLPICNHKTSQFDLCGHQDGAAVLQKHYRNGSKFLTKLPDGAAHVFYPSGALALIIVVTEQNGRVCIVNDDSTSLHQPLRALFRSDGRATCYHSNGNTWLTLNRKGGLCLDEKGAKVCGWSWGSPGLISAPLKPVFLSLNKAVGVRILGREKVFVSFLVGGQQAKFNVGSCCAQAECDQNITCPAPSVLKEELFVLAARLRWHLPIQDLLPHLTTTSNLQLKKTTQSAHHYAVAQKILEASANVMMSQREKDFIHQCLEEYLC